MPYDVAAREVIMPVLRYVLLSVVSYVLALIVSWPVFGGIYPGRVLLICVAGEAFRLWMKSFMHFVDPGYEERMNAHYGEKGARAAERFKSWLKGRSNK
jgi:hypothetical protein